MLKVILSLIDLKIIFNNFKHVDNSSQFSSHFHLHRGLLNMNSLSKFFLKKNRINLLFVLMVFVCLCLPQFM